LATIASTENVPRQVEILLIKGTNPGEESMKKGSIAAARMLVVLLFLILLTAWSWTIPHDVTAGDFKRSYVPISPGTVGVLYEPTPAGDKNHIALLIMHNFSDSLQHPAAVQLAQRGYRILAANCVFANNPGSDQDWDKVILQLHDAVKYLRQIPGVKKVILIGHSSGAPLMALYQNVAQNGPKACQGPEKIVKCPNTFTGFLPADGLILLDPVIGGMGANTLASIDPALVNEKNAAVVDPALDMYNPKNGFDPKGASYPEEFRHRFLAKQGQIMNQLIASALERLQKIEAGQGQYADDEPFIVPGARPTAPKLWRPDLRLMSHTRNVFPLLRPDGSVVKQVVRTVRVPSLTARTTASYNDSALTTSVRRFLSTFATRTKQDYDITEDNILGIDWNSSYGSTPGNVERVTVPLLILGMTGHYWLVSSEIAYEHAASQDKTLAFVEGATHGFTPCTQCERSPNEFGDTVKTTFDYVASWLGARF
jgi:pimeloyl-ACP methyl ester carboxylesterase